MKETKKSLCLTGPASHFKTIRPPGKLLPCRKDRERVEAKNLKRVVQGYFRDASLNDQVDKGWQTPINVTLTSSYNEEGESERGKTQRQLAFAFIKIQTCNEACSLIARASRCM